VNRNSRIAVANSHSHVRTLLPDPSAPEVLDGSDDLSGPHRLLTHSLTPNDADARCQYGWTQRNLVTELAHSALIRDFVEPGAVRQETRTRGLIPIRSLPLTSNTRPWILSSSADNLYLMSEARDPATDAELSQAELAWLEARLEPWTPIHR
jgi:hypothetical protein